MAARLRILFPFHGTGPGVGSEDYLLDVARGLAARGHEITIVAPHGGTVPGDLSSRVVRYRDLPIPRPLLWRIWYPIAFIFQALSVARLKLREHDVVVAGLLPPLLGLSWAARHAPRMYVALSPLAWFEMLSYGPNHRLGAWTYHVAQHWAWKTSDVVVSFTAAMTAVRSSFFNGAPRKLIESPPGVDVTRFTPGERNENLLAEFGIPPEAPIIVSFCRLIRSKDVAFLVRAIARAEVPEAAHLLVLGKGPEMDNLRQLARELGLTRRVHFAGFERCRGLFAPGPRLCVPSRLESFGLTLAQAMATGLPAVARRNEFPHVITSSESLVQHGKTGFLVTDEADMARSLALVLEDEKLRRMMSCEAAAAARQCFRWDGHLDVIEHALIELSES